MCPMRRTWLVASIAVIAVIAVIAMIAAPSVAAQTPSRIGTIVVAHGGDSLWNSYVIQAAASARTGGPVEVVFLMGAGAKRTPFHEAVGRLEKQGVSSITVVPMLVSSYSGHYEQVRHLAGDSVTLDDVMTHHLHMAGHARSPSRLPIRVAKAMDDSPHLARVLTDRSLALSKNPRERAVLIVGHGPNSAEEYAGWMAKLRVVADSVKARGGFRDVRVELVRDDATPAVRAEAVRRTRELAELQGLLTGQEVLVVPVLVSHGSISRDKLPADLKGLRIIYTGEALLPHVEMVRWIESAAQPSSSTESLGRDEPGPNDDKNM